MKKILKNSGISPAVGVILLIGITAAVATLAGIVLLDIGEDGLNQTAQAGVEVNETTNGVEVTWNTDSNAEQILVRANGQEYQLNSVNDSLTLGLPEDTNVSIIGVVDDDESVISDTTTESDTGNGTVKNYSPGDTSTVSGKVSVNPDIENATVRSVKNDTVISTTTTDSSGSYSLEAPENSRLEVIVEGFTYDSGKTLYGSTVRDLGSDLNSDVNIEFTEPESTVSVNGSEVLVANESYDGMKTIGSVEQLQAMKDDLSSDYMMLSDIDASDTSSWNSGSGFEPIGSSLDEFTGVLDGNGHEVTGLTIDRSDNDYTGLIGYGGSESEIKNIGVTNVDITGSDYTGGLIGKTSGSVSNSYATGSVTSTEWYTGGLVGYTEGQVNESYAEVNVDGGTYDYVGGLAGEVYEGSVSDSYATGSVTGGGAVGGLAGEVDYSSVSDSYAKGSVTGSGDEIGGLAGEVYEGSVSDSYATGDVQGNGYTAGLVGYMDGPVSNSYATGSVTSTEWYTGGLVAETSGSVSNSYATGDVDGGTYDYAGGLVGETSGSVSNSYATGSVTGGGDAGGLVGETYGSVSNSYATGSVTGSGDEIGGLAGEVYEGSVSDSYATGSVTGEGDVGGLVGYMDGSVSDSYYYQSPDNGSGTQLSDSDMKGEDAVSNMSGFDFDSVWTTTDEYPELQD